MRLITETIEDVQTLCEVSEDGKKCHFIEGIFMQFDTKNRNGRIYPKDILLNEVKRYSSEYVTTSRALGELGHPSGPSVNLERVSHMIKTLKEDGNNIIGKAKILDTPYGLIVKNLIDEGAKLGVSSRGIGSTKSGDDGVKIVQEDFMLHAVDIVADPSAPEAFVNGVMEGKEWVWNNGILEPRVIEEMHTYISKADSRLIEKAKIAVFKRFLSKLTDL